MDHWIKRIFSHGTASLLILVFVHFTAQMQNFDLNRSGRWSETGYHHQVAQGGESSVRKSQVIFTTVTRAVQAVAHPEWGTYYRLGVFLALLISSALLLFGGLGGGGLGLGKEESLWAGIFLALTPPVATAYALPDPPFALAVFGSVLAATLLSAKKIWPAAAVAGVFLFVSELSLWPAVAVGALLLSSPSSRGAAARPAGLALLALAGGVEIQHLWTHGFEGGLLGGRSFPNAWNEWFLAFSVLWIPALLGMPRLPKALLIPVAGLVLLENDWGLGLFVVLCPWLIPGAVQVLSDSLRKVNSDLQLLRIGYFLVALLMEFKSTLLDVHPLDPWRYLALAAGMILIEVFGQKRAAKAKA